MDTIEPQALAAIPYDSFATETRLAPTAQEQQTRLAPATQYQLTHDYLVPSLRDWLTRKQLETRRSRAELKLDERASAWNANREAKQLPTLTEWFGISRLTDRKHWTELQRSMMRSATRVHLTRVGLAAVLVIALSGIGLTTKVYIDRQRETLIAQKRIEKLEGEAGSRVDGLLKVDSSSLVPDYWQIALDDKQPALRRFHAASALAGFDPSNAAWDDSKFASFVSEQLVAVSPTYVSQYQELVRPVSAKLVPALTAIFRDPARGEPSASS